MDLPKRKSIRLKEYDYSQNGYYFITLCVQNRKHIFETENVGNDLCVVPQNRIIHNRLKDTENKFGIRIDKYVIMPDHIHMILNIEYQKTDHSVPDIMRWFKTMTTNDYIKGVNSKGFQPFDKKLWQKSYYEHIIRNVADYQEVWQYIDGNPSRKVELKDNSR